MGISLGNLGNVYESKGDFKQAEALWQEALSKLHPDSPEYQKVWGWLQEGD